MARFLVAALGVCIASPAWGWWAGGHGILTQASVLAAGDGMPDFFLKGIGMVAHAAYDPDVAKNRAAPALYAREHPEHYLDFDLLRGAALPGNRDAYLTLCDSVGVRADKVGFVAYAVAEWTERLAVALAEHRKWPGNPYIEQKCLVYAGFIAHYAQDLCQPLHLTKDFNGRTRADGTVEQKGIHEKVDALPETLRMDPSALAAAVRAAAYDSLMGAVTGELARGFGLVDRVYELGPSIPKYGEEGGTPDAAVVDFAMERARASVAFTASLYLTAWQQSQRVRLDGWLDRSTDGKGSTGHGAWGTEQKR